MQKLLIILKGGWQKFKVFGEFIASIVNFILLLPVYFIGVGMSAVFLKISGKKALELIPDKQQRYWKEYEIKTEKKYLKRMF